MLRKEHSHSGQQAADQELNAGHPHAVHPRRKIINDQNMYRKTQRTEQHQKISAADGKSIRNAQQIQPGYCQQNADPDPEPHCFFQKDSEKRNNDNIKGRDKSGLSHRRILDAELLQIAGYKKSHAAEDTTHKQLLLPPRILYSHTFRFRTSALPSRVFH